jgi:hypothetical protein
MWHFFLFFVCDEMGTLGVEYKSLDHWDKHLFCTTLLSPAVGTSSTAANRTSFRQFVVVVQRSEIQSFRIGHQDYLRQVTHRHSNRKSITRELKSASNKLPIQETYYRTWVTRVAQPKYEHPLFWNPFISHSGLVTRTISDEWPIGTQTENR